MTTTTSPQLHRQLELNIAALSRSFRQALRHAVKHDPQGTEATSATWQVVAARQAMLLDMLAAVFRFTQPAQPPTAPAPRVSEAAPAPVAVAEVAVEADPAPLGLSMEDALAIMPPDVQELHGQFAVVAQWPTHTHRQRRERTQELDRLDAEIERRLKEWSIASATPFRSPGKQV